MRLFWVTFCGYKWGYVGVQTTFAFAYGTTVSCVVVCRKVCTFAFTHILSCVFLSPSLSCCVYFFVVFPPSILSWAVLTPCCFHQKQKEQIKVRFKVDLPAADAICISVGDARV